MRVLLDTHAFLWFVLNEPHLSTVAGNTIADPANEVFVSPATYWEVAIKIGKGKYSLSSPFEAFFESEIRYYNFSRLPIEIRHAAVLTILPHHHGDPFDRMLIAQAMSENLSIVSVDPVIDQYGVPGVPLFHPPKNVGKTGIQCVVTFTTPSTSAGIERKGPFLGK